MTPALSTYLNILRVFGALAVFFGHMCIWNASCGPVAWLPNLGSDGVVTFFVLSGYVVAYAAEEKDKTLRRFAVNRCARIYSVMLPALLLTLVFEYIGIRDFPDAYNTVYDRYQLARLWLYLPMWLSFTSEFWSYNEPIFTNGAFWSLCFEVWFYVFFTVGLFTRGRRRLALLAGVALLVGPKICALFPLWWLGALAYRRQRTLSLRPAPARVLLALSLAGFVALKATGTDTLATEAVNAALGQFPLTSMQMAWLLPGYLLLALCIAGSIFAVRFAALDGLARLAAPVGVVASFTFTIYLIHLPALKFFVALGFASMLWPALLTLAIVLVLGLLTERRLGPWRAAFSALFAAAERVRR